MWQQQCPETCSSSSQVCLPRAGHLVLCAVPVEESQAWSQEGSL